MKSTKPFLLAAGLLSLTLTTLHAQVGINNSATSPDPSAILDLKTGNTGVNKGFLPQSVALTNVATAAPVTSPATGLIVYSSTAPTGGNGIGYYYWNGTAWLGLGGVSGAGLTGQVTYWGASNSLKGDTNLFYDNADHWLGISTSHPTEPLDIDGYNGATTAKFGAAQPVCFVANSPMVGFNAFWSSLGSETYYSTDYAGIIEFNQNIPGGFQFMTAPTGTALTAATMTPAITILNNGNVGIGTISPTAILHVSSATSSYAGEFDNAAAASGVSILANATGTVSYGVVATGTFEGVQSVCPTANASYALVGANTAGSGTSNGIGTWGQTAQSKGYGVEGVNYYSLAGGGIGIYGAGSGASGYILPLGANFPGIYGEGTNMGVCGYADNGVTVWPVYGSNDNGARWSSISAYESNTDYKVLGSGVAATIIKDSNKIDHIMNCPEAPEVLFEDYGSATLTGGKVHVDLDQLYAKNVTINEKHPLRVMITLNDQCNGVYVTNRTATGFDVVELNNGTSNAAFTYEVIANRADEYNADGTLLSKFADNRYQVLIKPTLETKGTTTVSNPLISKPAAPAFVPAPRVITPGATAGSTLTQK